MNEDQIQILQREGDPRIYLQARGKWYYYDPNSRPLGEGAMGTVYLGYSCNSNERVAVKRVRDSYANDPTIRKRAQMEASLSFSHPNLVQMIGMCEFPNHKGPIFVLSNYISGVTLETHVREQLNQLPAQERVEKICYEMCSVLDALQYLHARGVLHRDVKPSNIMIENGNTIKLMDLGIARLNGGNSFSRFGFIGTPQYAAPEQILREENQNDIDSRADLYAVGITFYKLLTGVNPFDSKVESEILANQVKKKLPYHQAIPRRLFKVLQKATEKDPNARYASAAEFKEAVNNALYGGDNLGTGASTIIKWLLAAVAALAVIFIIVKLIID